VRGSKGVGALGLHVTSGWATTPKSTLLIAEVRNESSRSARRAEVFPNVLYGLSLRRI
jgi:hypothetical protein